MFTSGGDRTYNISEVNNMKKIQIEVMEDVGIALGIALSIDQIKTILGIVLLVLEITWLLYKAVKVIVVKIKNKDYKGAIEDAKKTVEEVNKEIKKYGDRKDTK